MRMKAIFRITCAGLLLMGFSSCVGIVAKGKDQLEYENTPYKQYNFGKNNELSIQLPVPVLSGGGKLYSNILRRKWVGAGFIDYLSVSRMGVMTDKNIDARNIIYIRYTSSAGNGYILSREFVIIINDIPIMLDVATCLPGGEEHIAKYPTEDNALFIKVLESVRVKRAKKLYKIKVDYAKLAEKMKEIAFKLNSDSSDDEIPYELIEAVPVAPVAEQTKVHSDKDAK